MVNQFGKVENVACTFRVTSLFKIQVDDVLSLTTPMLAPHPTN